MSVAFVFQPVVLSEMNVNKYNGVLSAMTCTDVTTRRKRLSRDGYEAIMHNVRMGTYGNVQEVFVGLAENWISTADAVYIEGKEKPLSKCNALTKSIWATPTICIRSDTKIYAYACWEYSPFPVLDYLHSTCQALYYAGMYAALSLRDAVRKLF